MRKAESRQKREVPITETIVASETPSSDALLAQRLEWALDRLPGGMRKVLILHDVEGYTHDEIGKMLGTAAGTSKSQLFKARGKMRELLKSLNTQDNREESETWSI